MAALEAWLAQRRGARDLTGGGSDAERPLFCAVTKGGRLIGTELFFEAVMRLIKQAAGAAGLDPEHFSSHSLGAGLATAAGAGLVDLMRETRHRSTAVALGYELWRNNVTARVFAARDEASRG
jgi:hypothetical protein